MRQGRRQSGKGPENAEEGEMIILQTAGGGEVTSFPWDGLLKGRVDQAPATSFRNSDYIHKLNRTLQAEVRALSAYREVLSRHPEIKHLHQALTDHQNASSELVRLVIANRGVPEDKAALNLGLSRRFVQICSAIPVRFFERASLSTLRAMETNLASAYTRLADEAPMRDHEVL